jgi:hypothetical protein
LRYHYAPSKLYSIVGPFDARKRFYRVEMGFLESLKAGASNALQTVKDAGTGVLGKVTAMKDSAVSGLKTAGGAIKTGVTGAMNVVKDSAGVIGGIAKEHAGAIGQVLGGAAGALVGGPAGAALGQRLGNMAGGWVQGGGLEKTKVGQAVTGLAKSVASGDGNGNNI